MGQKNAYTTAMRRRAKRKAEAGEGEKTSSRAKAATVAKAKKASKSSKPAKPKKKAEPPVVWPFEVGHSLDGVKLLEQAKGKADMWLYRGRHTRLQKDVWLLAFAMDAPDCATWIKHAKQLASQGEWGFDLSEAEGYGVVVIQEQDQALVPDDILSAIRGRRHELPQKEDGTTVKRGWLMGAAALIVVLIILGVVFGGGAPSSADRSVSSMLADADWKLRREGMRILEKSFSLEALAQVGPMVNDEHWRVRLAACEIMGAWARPEAINYLSVAALETNPPSVRKAAQAALDRIRAANPKYP